jgi:hypothetical protein
MKWFGGKCFSGKSFLQKHLPEMQKTFASKVITDPTELLIFKNGFLI